MPSDRIATHHLRDQTGRFIPRSIGSKTPHCCPADGWTSMVVDAGSIN
jgi:hypothetical protein